MGISYDVVLKGVRTGADPSATRSRLAALLKTSPAKLDALVAAGEQVVKRGVDLALGEQYRAAITAAGGICELVPAFGATGLAAESGQKSRQPGNNPPGVRCPKCA